MEITLEQLLSFREERAEKQREMIEAYKAPLISFTMNIPGQRKTSKLIERAFEIGVSLVFDAISEMRVHSVYKTSSKCGPVLIISVDGDAKEIKQLLTKIEDTHPLGRLYDMDVIDDDFSHLSRSVERGCIVCSAPGRACARSRVHPVGELVAVTNGMMENFFLSYDANRIAAMAAQSLFLEVHTTPKPGLVDSENSGSHSDMTISDFERSAGALEPYFVNCIKAGFDSKSLSATPLFLKLRELGIKAENEMYSVTNGKNTHKGAIFSYGIILGAIGRLLDLDGALPKISDILSESVRISRFFLENDISSFDGKTAGEQAYINLGVRGIRGEVMEGFPTLSKIAIPVFKSLITDGKNKNDAGVITLLHLIANVYDTCLYKRGGEDGVLYARDYASALIKEGNITNGKVRKMNDDFIEKNLSPGGCADLLALTYFLYSVENG